MRNYQALAIVIATSIHLPLAAATDESQRVGPETRAWTALQLDESASSTIERPMSGDVAERVYQRYADSFAHPIPEELNRESFVGEGSGQ